MNNPVNHLGKLTRTLLRPATRFTHIKRSRIGAPPGSLEYTGVEREEPISLTLIDYKEDFFEEIKGIDSSWKERVPSEQYFSWLDVSGVHDVAVIEEIGSHLGLHPLIMEDIIHPHQRPKFEPFDDQLYIVLRMLHTKDDGSVQEEQISIVLASNFILSFQQEPGDVFDPVRQRLRTGKGVIRTQGPDYLAYALIDLIVDYYFVLLERIGGHVQELEMEVMDNPSKDTIHTIRALKQTIVAYRKDIWPVRELVSAMTRDEGGLIKKRTATYLRDVYDHTIQVIDLMETYRDQLSGLTELYLSSLSQRMNEVMQVLTIIGSIFIPLTFIAGIYGMNFARMPELQWQYGYPMAWGVMLLTAGGLFLYFKRRKWL
jgi:magnesium transporter